MWENLKWVQISTKWVMIIMILLCLSISSSFSSPLNNITHIKNNPTYLDDYLYSFSSKSLANKTHTGVLYNISLPANFSDMKVSVVRLRSGALRAKGANFSYFKLPRKMITRPYVRRLAIMYENLGNLSSEYYELPGYTFLTKIIGFAVYNATDLSAGGTSKRLNVTLHGEPIEVEFSRGLELSSQEKNNDTNVSNKIKKCVTFDPKNGVVELADMLRPNVCLSQGVGHFAIAMPKVNNTVSPPPSPSPSPSTSPLPSDQGSRGKGKKVVALWVWWVVGFTGGIVGLMLLISCIAIVYRALASRKMRRMEKTSVESESLGTKWIGNSRLPLAPASRTQAVLENNFAP